LSCARDVFDYTFFLFEDTTTFSKDFSETKFRTIRQGQTKQDVQLILGEPLSKDTDQMRHEEIWRYSQGRSDRNYWCRVIVFGQDDRAKVIGRYYDVD
jgi:outer membrane protein assembly factor BamE (lipoprotein component of BamABCDE complex)